jgi:hypothetical protein
MMKFVAKNKFKANQQKTKNTINTINTIKNTIKNTTNNTAHDTVPTTLSTKSHTPMPKMISVPKPIAKKQKPIRTLKFVHITKTGGSSIEDIGISHGLFWGKYHTEYGPWHKILKNNLIKNKYDWFMVVRNPYTRILSEFHCKWGGVGSAAKNYTIKQFNEYVVNKIINRNKLGNHYTEQYLYRKDMRNIHVLKFENLKKDFNDLMKKYKLNCTLNVHTNSNDKVFTIKDFDEKTIELIKKVYKNDFEIFNYSKDVNMA